MNDPVPARVDAATKDVLHGLVDHAVGNGWSLPQACQVLGLDRRRAHRWITRRHARTLTDAPPGASLNALLPDEVAAIHTTFDAWGEVDRSQRRLAHRGSPTGTFWAAPPTVRRVSNAADLRFRPLPRPARETPTVAGLDVLHPELDLDLRHHPLSRRGHVHLHHPGPGLAQVDHHGGLNRGESHPNRSRVHPGAGSRGPAR